jgi:hypothetical protein
LGKVFNLILEETMVHGSSMGKDDAVISLTFHPIMHGTTFPRFYFVLHDTPMFPQLSNKGKRDSVDF